MSNLTREWVVKHIGEDHGAVDVVFTWLERAEARWKAAKPHVTRAGVKLAEHMTHLATYTEAMNDARAAMLASPSREAWETYKLALVRVSTIWGAMADRVEELIQPKQ